MCHLCNDEDGVSFVGGVKREKRRRGPTETLYLPGDRIPTMIARAMYRDAKLNSQERQAKWLATDCATDRHAKEQYGGKWICTLKRPCRHCRWINN